MAAKDTYSAVGKEVLLNDTHYADAIDPEGAQAIAYAMNNVYLSKLGALCMTCKAIGGHLANCVERGNDAR
jgi:hypothetical protein